MTASTGTRRRQRAPLALAAALLAAALIGLVAKYGDTGLNRPARTGPQVASVPTAVATEPPAKHTGSPAPRTGLAAAAVAAGDAAAAAHPDSSIGVAVHDRVTGETAVGAGGATPMYSASLVKLIVAIDMLDRARSGLEVEPEDYELLRRTLGPSDDEAMNTLWSRFDGVGAVSRVASRLGLSDTRAPADPSQWGETVLSARDVAVLYQHVLRNMRPADEDLIMNALASAPAEATDGFDQEFGLLAGDRVASKQAWMCCLDGEVNLHSAGIADPGRRFAVAILSSTPTGNGYDDARAAVTAVADAVRAPLR